MNRTTCNARLSDGRRRHLLLIIVAAVGVLATLLAAGLGAGIRINLTPSEPLGLWRLVSLKRPAGIGDLVFVCPPQTAVMHEARERGYLRSGLCADGIAPLIKTIVATPGQRVDIGASVSIDGKPLAHSALIAKDGSGRALVPFESGVVPPGEVFLHSDFVGSFDSRYFGPVPLRGVLGLAQEVLTYAP